jgi:pimeloyl-ACP methyl ester carboxylesterase
MLGRYAATDLMVPAAEANETFTAPRLEDLHAPALVINGEFDLESRRLAGEALGTLLPRAERQIISGAAHLTNLDNPQGYNEVLRRFLARHLLANGAA